MKNDSKEQLVTQYLSAMRDVLQAKLQLAAAEAAMRDAWSKLPPDMVTLMRASMSVDDSGLPASASLREIFRDR